MPYSMAGRNAMLDALGALAVFQSLHSTYPGDTGTAEVTGGSPAYARKAKTWNSAASGTKDDSNAPVFDVPAGNVAYIGLWSAVTAGTFYGYAPAGGTPFRYNATIATDKVNVTAHGLVNTDRVVFMNGTPSAGLTEGTHYFVVSATTNDFSVSLTSGGAAVDITADNAAAASRVSKVVIEVFAAQGTYTATDTDIDLLDA